MIKQIKFVYKYLFKDSWYWFNALIVYLIYSFLHKEWLTAIPIMIIYLITLPLPIGILKHYFPHLFVFKKKGDKDGH